MTDEEKAKITKDYLNSTFKQTEENQLAIMIGSKCFYEGLEKGLAEGRPKWHDLRKNPDDLPPRINKLSIVVVNEIGTPCHYDYQNKRWINWSLIGIETPENWCELPKY